MNQTFPSEQRLTARLFDIKKMAVHDGPGIRTTIFFKGCPLRCQWCHSPESIWHKKQVRYTSNLCRDCGRCTPVCPSNCHWVEENGRHGFDHTNCTACGACVNVCPHDALGMIGYDATIDEVVEEVLKDKKYYDASGGGVTLSGGEVMMQAEFATELAMRFKNEGLHTALDTCGAAPWSRYEAILPYVDLVLFDVKETDAQKHRRFTGAEIAQTLGTLFQIDRNGTEIMLRCPLVPGLNAEERHFEALGKLADSLNHILEIHAIPFHPFGASKCESIGWEYLLKDTPAVEDETAEEWIRQIQSHTRVTVCRG